MLAGRSEGIMDAAPLWNEGPDLAALESAGVFVLADTFGEAVVVPFAVGRHHLF